MLFLVEFTNLRFDAVVRNFDRHLCGFIKRRTFAAHFNLHSLPLTMAHIRNERSFHIGKGALLQQSMLRFDNCTYSVLFCSVRLCSMCRAIISFCSRLLMLLCSQFEKRIYCPSNTILLSQSNTQKNTLTYLTFTQRL